MFYDVAYGVGIDSQNRIVVAGYTGSTQANNAADRDFAVARLTPSGTLDTTFDFDGKQVISFGAFGDAASAVSVDSQDRIVVTGSTYNGSNYDVAVARLTVTGALDTSFDGDGKQTIPVGAGDDGASGVRIDSQGRIVLAGSTNNGSNTDFALIRLTNSGALDAGFNGTGKLTVSFGSGDDSARAVAIDSLDRVVAAGGILNGNNDTFDVVRVTATGALDTSFDGDGKQAVSFGSQDGGCVGVAIDSSNRVVMSGVTYFGANEIGVAHLTAAGAADSTFDGDGKKVISIFGVQDYAGPVAIDANDRIVISGASYFGSTTVITLARLTVSGGFDGSMNGDGKASMGVKGRSLLLGYHVAIDHHGRYLVSGRASDDTNDDHFMVTRYTSAGVLDTSFAGTGIVTLAYNDVNSGASIVLDSTDRIVIAGTRGGDFSVIRLTSNGALDPTFDGDGKLLIDMGSGNDAASAVAIDSLGRIVVVGQISSGFDSDFAVARITASGTLDTSFDGDGKKAFDFSGSQPDAALAVAIDSLNRVVVGGITGRAGYEDFGVARLTVTGALDSSFDGDGKQTVDFGGGYEASYGVAVDSLNRVLLAGYTDNNGPDHDFAVARITSAGAS